MTTRSALTRAAAGEAIGTFMLLATVAGSGIMAARLSGGNDAIALLVNSLATGAVLIALIFTFGPLSGAHFNPVVTVAAAMERTISWSVVPMYVVAQTSGAILGVIAAHAMFALPLIQMGTRARHGFGQVFSEIVATFGLIAVIHGTGRRTSVVPVTVGLYITAAYWFTASTSFANPAVTIARALTNTFSGIRPDDVLPFIGAQFVGGLAATYLFRWLLPRTSDQERA